MTVAGRNTQRTGLGREFDYYLAQQDKLVEKYDGRIIVIKDCQVLGNYDSDIEAVVETQKQGHEIGTFLVQAVSPGPEAYTQHHTRAMRL